MLRTLSLCSGVGGLDQADPDPDASRVMSHNYPGVPNLGDITVYDFSLLRNEGVNLLTAGYPCQPFSVAGRRKGNNDVRHLYPFISGAVRVLRPGLIFLENVAGHRSKGFGEVLWDLSESGYRVAWTSVRASDVGAPHQRERVFILAADSNRFRVRTEQESVSRSCDQTFPGRSDSTSSDTRSFRLETSGLSGGSREEVTEPPRDRPSVDWQEYTPAVRRWEQLRGIEVPYPVALGPRGGRRVSAEFGEWIMGYPAGWISGVPGVSLRAAAKLYGNGVVPQQGARAFAHLVSVLGLEL